jgi:hypothetical protein
VKKKYDSAVGYMFLILKTFPCSAAVRRHPNPSTGSNFSPAGMTFFPLFCAIRSGSSFRSWRYSGLWVFPALRTKAADAAEKL